MRVLNIQFRKDVLALLIISTAIISHFSLKKSYITYKEPLYTSIDTSGDSLLVEQDPREVWLNIFVHGIMSIKPHISISNFMNFMTDEVQDTIYSKTVDLMRNDPHFYANQAMQGRGLHQIDISRIEPGYASGALANIFEKVHEYMYQNNGPKNYYYTYGWSGLLSHTARKREAEHFYLSLKHETERIRARGQTPRIRIISYSHGGNFCLNLALAKSSLDTAHPFFVDELVLMGVPIQKETDYLIADPIFKRVYNIYSRGDRIQKLDFFSFDRFFSNRIFERRHDFHIPDNKLIQIQLRLTRNNSFQPKEKVHPSVYALHNPAIISGKHRLFRDSSPGHAELWFFGWTPQNYRKKFVLNPLPAVAVLPVILSAVHQFKDHELFNTPTIVDIRPEHEIMIVKNQKSENVLLISEFIAEDKLEELKELSLKYTPDAYTAQAYDDHIENALILAQQLHNEEMLKKQQSIAQRRMKKSPLRPRLVARHANNIPQS